MRRPVAFALLGMGLLLQASCDCTYDYSYTVKNKTDTTIVVKWRNNGRADSAVIEKDSSEMLYITDHGLESCGRGPVLKGVSYDLTELSVAKGGSVSKRDYLKNDNWAYDEGAFTATVSNSEF